MDFYNKVRETEEKKKKECLNRMKRALNTRIYDNMYPHWRCHSSLKRWSTINYPATLDSHKRFKTPHKPTAATSSYLTLPSKRKCPITQEIELKAIRMKNDPVYNESFFNKLGKQQANFLRKEYYNAIHNTKRLHLSSRASGATLSTHTYEDKKKLIEELNKKAEPVSALKPVSSILGPKLDPLNCRRVKQLNELELENTESDEDEDTYKFKVPINTKHRDYHDLILHNQH